MVGLLTFGNKKYEALDSTMRATIAPLHSTMQQILPLIDRDTQAFSGYMVRVRTASQRECRSKINHRYGYVPMYDL